MPPLHSQSIVITDATHATLTLNTVQFGVLVITISVSGTTWTLTATKDDVTIGTATLLSPTIAQVEASCQSTITNAMTANAILAMNFRCHVFTLSPLNLNIGSFNTDVAIPTQWWRSG